MAPQNVNLWVSAGAFSSPYYRFYTDSSGSQELTDNTLDIGKNYTFRRLGEASEHPFYISDKGLKTASSDAVLITGEGRPTQGISGNQSFRLEFTDLASATDQLKYYCSAHSSMQGTFRLVGEYDYPPTQFTISNLNISVENLQAAESQIRDADIAEEVALLTRNQIMVQASTAMVGQANLIPQSVLQLLQ